MTSRRVCFSDGLGGERDQALELVVGILRRRELHGLGKVFEMVG